MSSRRSFLLATCASSFSALIGGCAFTADVKFLAPDHSGPIKSLMVVYELGEDKFFPRFKRNAEIPPRELAFETNFKKIAPLNGVDLRGIYRASSLTGTQFGISHILWIRSIRAFRTMDGMGTRRINLLCELYEVSSTAPRLVWQADAAHIYFSSPAIFSTPEQELSGNASGLVNQILTGLHRSQLIQLPSGQMIDVDGKPYTSILIGK